MISENLSCIQKSLQSQAASLNIPEPCLVAVTKTVPAEKIMEAYREGVRDFGENRVQELLEKMPHLPGDIRWHLIGHLQTNKVKYVLGKTALIHSLDRIELADEIIKTARKKKIQEVSCLIQVNSSGEETKFGFAPGQVMDFVKRLPADTPLKIKGLMTIGPLTDDKEVIRECFRATRILRDDLIKAFPRHSWQILSMGMSGDYAEALAEGSNCVRIGSLIFGERPKG